MYVLAHFQNVSYNVNNGPLSYKTDLQDKYCLSEYLTNASMAAVLNVLEAMGLDGEKLSVLVNWATEGRSVWLGIFLK